MNAVAAAEPVPLSLDSDQVIRVGGTRVTLETVIDTFNTGAAPEEIAYDFPVLRLDDVYAVITYYLRHRSEVESYLELRRAEAEACRKRIEKICPQDGIRDRLLQRLSS